MKDRLQRSKWVNRFPSNPTQTQYIRFIKSPKSKLESLFTKNRGNFESILKNRLKTRYAELFLGE